MGKLSKAFSAIKGRARAAKKGQAGYDNPRENIDPHVRTQTVSQQQGTIQHTPANAKDIVNKEYVDAAVSGGLQLFLTENASGDVAGYMQIVPAPTGDAEENTVTAVSSAADVLLEDYATEVGCSCVSNLSSLPAGIVRLHMHAKGETAGKLKMYYKLYKRDDGDVETLLGTSNGTEFLTTSEAEYDMHLTLAEEVAWISTDRIVLKLYGSSTLAVNRDLTFYVEGETASRLRITGAVPTGVAVHTLDDAYDAEPGVARTINVDDKEIDMIITGSPTLRAFKIRLHTSGADLSRFLISDESENILFSAISDGGKIVSSTWLPVGATSDVGSSITPWRDGYFAGTVYGGADALASIPTLSGANIQATETISGANIIVTGDHTTVSGAKVVNVVYGTGAPETAADYPIGTIFAQYTD